MTTEQMPMEELLAREAMILTLLRGYPSLASSISRGTIESYIIAVADYSSTALADACDRFRIGDVDGYDRRFPPNTAELATMARMYDTIEKREAGVPAEKLKVYPIGAPVPDGYVPLGPIEVDAGHGRIDMRGLSHADKEFVLQHHRLPPKKQDDQQQIGFVPKFQRA